MEGIEKWGCQDDTVETEELELTVEEQLEAGLWL